MKLLLLLALFSSATAFAELDCSRKAGSLPQPKVAAGTPNAEIPIEHIIVIMQENHSFDRYFGRLNVAGYGDELDGVSPEISNPDAQGKPVAAFHETSLCSDNPGHRWNVMHGAWNDGRNDGFVKLNGRNAMGYYEKTELPYYYALANEFAISDRYFASVLSQTYPNRFFLYAATAFSHIRNDKPKKPFGQKTIFDVFNRHGISWRYYTDGKGYLRHFEVSRKSPERIVRLKHYKEDLDAERLPQVVFLESDENRFDDEHPPFNVELGQAWVADKINALMKSTSWKKSALFFTYDEAGGFHDHVAPPPACVPDAIKPKLGKDSVRAKYDRYGFRVPFVAISPFAKRHYLSHETFDHSSILKFIETKFNLPALTARDANSSAMLDLFDFANPNFEPPTLPEARVDPEKARECMKKLPKKHQKKHAD